jgi:5-formyltetrahydrofolate cyclo-ligase
MKQELRKTLSKQRKQLINDNEGIVTNLPLLLSKYSKILLYYPIFNEPNVLSIMNKCLDKTYYLPYTYTDYIEIRKVENLDDLELDLYNVPTSKIKTNDEVEVAIVPAVAMNYKKYRLGYGKGYYDKFLKNKDILKIAVVNSEFVIDVDYQDEWDVCFDIIVTEKEVI